MRCTDASLLTSFTHFDFLQIGAPIRIKFEENKPIKMKFFDRIEGGNDWFAPQRMKCYWLYKAIFQDYTQILNFWLMVMFGKNHLSLITMNIIRWYWNKRLGEGWFDISILE